MNFAGPFSVMCDFTSAWTLFTSPISTSTGMRFSSSSIFSAIAVRFDMAPMGSLWIIALLYRSSVPSDSIMHFTASAPADSPNSVILSGSPPNDDMFSLTHLRPSMRSKMPLFDSFPSLPLRNPSTPRRYPSPTTITPHSVASGIRSQRSHPPTSNAPPWTQTITGRSVPASSGTVTERYWQLSSWGT